MKPIKVAHIFWETHMGLGHARLELLFKKKVKQVIAPGEMAIFVNRSMTAVKLMTFGQIFLYHRAVKMLTVDTIRLLPCAYGGPALDLTQDLRKRLAEALAQIIEERKEAA